MHAENATHAARGNPPARTERRGLHGVFARSRSHICSLSRERLLAACSARPPGQPDQHRPARSPASAPSTGPHPTASPTLTQRAAVASRSDPSSPAAGQSVSLAGAGRRARLRVQSRCSARSCRPAAASSANRRRTAPLEHGDGFDVSDDDGLRRLPVRLHQSAHLELLGQPRWHVALVSEQGDDGRGLRSPTARAVRRRRSPSASSRARSAPSSRDPPDPDLRAAARAERGGRAARPERQRGRDATATRTGQVDLHAARPARTTSEPAAVARPDAASREPTAFSVAWRLSRRLRARVRHGHSVTGAERLNLGRMAVESVLRTRRPRHAFGDAAQPGHARAGHEGDAALPDARDRRGLLPAADLHGVPDVLQRAASRRTSSSAPRPARSRPTSSRTSSAA